MNVISLQEEALYLLLDEVLAKVQDKLVNQDKWISDKEAMRMLNIKSKTTLQKLRDERKIRFSQPQKRIIMYDRDSINAYLEKHAMETLF